MEEEEEDDCNNCKAGCEPLLYNCTTVGREVAVLLLLVVEVVETVASCLRIEKSTMVVCNRVGQQ
jgi:hypothetical protein